MTPQCSTEGLIVFAFLTKRSYSAVIVTAQRVSYAWFGRKISFHSDCRTRPVLIDWSWGNDGGQIPLRTGRAFLRRLSARKGAAAQPGGEEVKRTARTHVEQSESQITVLQERSWSRLGLGEIRSGSFAFSSGVITKRGKLHRKEGHVRILAGAREIRSWA